MMAARADAAKTDEQLRGEAEQIEARRHHDVCERLSAIACPTLVACGRFDGIAPLANGEWIAAHIRGAALRCTKAATRSSSRTRRRCRRSPRSSPATRADAGEPRARHGGPVGAAVPASRVGDRRQVRVQKQRRAGHARVPPCAADLIRTTTGS